MHAERWVGRRRSSAKSLGALAAVLVACVCVPRRAAADQEVHPSLPPPPPQRTPEITLDLGYTQGIGDIGAGLPSLTDTAGPGVSAGVGLGYRFTPLVMLGLYGTGAAFSRGGAVGTTGNIWSATAGVELNLHVDPWRPVHPWFGFASGWRGYWIHDEFGNNFTRHGFELARFQIGLDITTVRGVAFGPVIGADVSMFVTQAEPGQAGFSSISGPAVNTFLFAGVKGRFDFGL